MLLSDLDLVQRLLARDVRAMAEFYRLHHYRLYTVVLRIVRNAHTAEDLLQDGLLKVWQGIATYDPDRGSFFTWAARVYANTALDYVRSAAHRNATQTGSLEDSLH